MLGPESLPSSVAARRSSGSGPLPASSGSFPAISSAASAGESVDVDEPLTDAKRRASAAFEKRYLLAVMERAKGSVSEAARLSGLDRTNFRRLLQRHGIDAVTFKG